MLFIFKEENIIVKQKNQKKNVRNNMKPFCAGLTHQLQVVCVSAALKSLTQLQSQRPSLGGHTGLASARGAWPPSFTVRSAACPPSWEHWLCRALFVKCLGPKVPLILKNLHKLYLLSIHNKKKVRFGARGASDFQIRDVQLTVFLKTGVPIKTRAFANY